MRTIGLNVVIVSYKDHIMSYGVIQSNLTYAEYISVFVHTIMLHTINVSIFAHFYKRTFCISSLILRIHAWVVFWTCMCYTRYSNASSVFTFFRPNLSAFQCHQYCFVTQISHTSFTIRTLARWEMEYTEFKIKERTSSWSTLGWLCVWISLLCGLLVVVVTVYSVLFYITTDDGSVRIDLNTSDIGKPPIPCTQTRPICDPESPRTFDLSTAGLSGRVKEFRRLSHRIHQCREQGNPDKRSLNWATCSVGRNVKDL